MRVRKKEREKEYLKEEGRWQNGLRLPADVLRTWRRDVGGSRGPCGRLWECSQR